MTFREGEGTPLEASSPAFFLFFPRLYKQPQPQRPRTVTCTQENCNRMAIFKNNVSGKGVLLPPISSLAIPILRLALLHHLQNPFFLLISPSAAPRMATKRCADSPKSKANKNSAVPFLSSLCAPPSTPADAAGPHVQQGTTSCSSATPSASWFKPERSGVPRVPEEYFEYLRSFQAIWAFCRLWVTTKPSRRPVGCSALHVQMKQ